MPKGYWIANNIVHDQAAYDSYKAANGPVFARWNARFVVRGGQQQVVEGQANPRTVVIEFDSYADAIACYESPEYQTAKALRTPASESRVIIVEGYDG